MVLTLKRDWPLLVSILLLVLIHFVFTGKL